MKTSVLYFLLITGLLWFLMAFMPGTDSLSQDDSINTAPFTRRMPKPSPAENPYYIVVDKSEYELKVYDDEGWYATYPILFGSRDLSDKMKEGDKKTPDGQFKVIQKK